MQPPDRPAGWARPGVERIVERMARTPDIYCAHFGLRERPFSLVPDPTFLFWGQAHKRAYTVLEYGLMTRAPITLLTGEVGAGKTTLLQHMLTGIEEDVTVGLVSNAQGNQGELLRWVLHAFDQPAPAERTYVDLFAQFQDFLLEEYASGRRVILIFDEAQHLGRRALEELRMFTNINSVKDEILQLILVGQPELRDMVAEPDLTQFAQRVAVSFHLPALSASDVAAYLAHRLEVAGGDPSLFAPGATLLIHDRTGGVPRLVNQLADFALLYAFTDGAEPAPGAVSEAVVRQVLEDDVFFAASRGRRDPLRLVDPVMPPADRAPDPAPGRGSGRGSGGAEVTPLPTPPANAAPSPHPAAHRSGTPPAKISSKPVAVARPVPHPAPAAAPLARPRTATPRVFSEDGFVPGLIPGLIPSLVPGPLPAPPRLREATGEAIGDAEGEGGTDGSDASAMGAAGSGSGSEEGSGKGSGGGAEAEAPPARGVRPAGFAAPRLQQKGPRDA